MKIKSTLLSLIVLSLLVGCGKITKVRISADNPKEPAIPHSVVFHFSNETLSCVNGGQRVSEALDTNDNGVLDNEDTALYAFDMCNGEPGAQGVAGESIVGKAGNDGHNGHSIISVSRSASEEECATEGTALDIYLDLDNSFSYSEGDLYMGGMAACNGNVGSIGATGATGATGSQGSPGVNATASILASSSSCVNIIGNYYMKNNVLYLEDDTVLCDGSHDKIELNNGDSVWLSANKLAIFASSLLKVITFN